LSANIPQHGTLSDHLAAIIENSDDAIISKDLNGIIRSWNRGAERIFGYTEEEAVGRHISLLAAPDRLEDFPNIIERISRGERIEHFQTARRAKDGRILSVSLTVSPIKDAAGQIIGASKIARDITNQMRDQRALREANDSLKRSNADLEHFAYSASHDLQEPLRMVSTYAELLQRKFQGSLGTTGDEYIRFILSGAARMEQLLRDLRVFVQASVFDEKPLENVDANVALDAALQDLRRAVDASGATITRGALPLVHLHAFQMEQLFQNLISNAIRYRAEESPRVHVCAEPLGAQWKFSIRDNGIGVDPRYKDQIFGIFKRLHTYDDYPGTGMGLAICQRIIESNGGRIWVESEPGQGSTFLFTVPDGRPHTG
jgi:PAS domain S-box-containing protein